MSTTARRLLLDRKGRPYEPAVSPRLKRLLYAIFVTVALLGANSVYLASVTFLSWLKSPVTYENQFYIWMFLMHLVLGLGLIGPFLVFGFGHMRTSLYRKNRKAVRAGLALFIASIVLGLTGLGLIRISGLPRLEGTARTI